MQPPFLNLVLFLILYCEAKTKYYNKRLGRIIKTYNVFCLLFKVQNYYINIKIYYFILLIAAQITNQAIFDQMFKNGL